MKETTNAGNKTSSSLSCLLQSDETSRLMDTKKSPYFTAAKDLKVEKLESHTTARLNGINGSKTRSKKKELNQQNGEYVDNKPKRIKTLKNAPDPIQLKKDIWEPENWEEVLDNIRKMRVNRDAPVDHMGAENCIDKNSPPEVRRFQVLVSLMLSSQTKDQITFAAMQKLIQHGLTIQNVINTEENDLASIIHPVGFWKKKAFYIKKTAAVLAAQYNNDIPKTVDELCKLPGVGQKMAVLTVNIAWETTIGIGVDTHVHRIANRLGWTRQATKTPNETQKALEDWLPNTLWSEANLLLVGFGQQQCTPVKPLCVSCLNRGLCPVGKNQ